MPALGLTDHGVMNGAVELYKACRAHDVKPIIGLEAYLVGDVAEIKTKTRWERNHLTLLASSDTGFRNLVQLSSAGFLEGFARGKANVDLAMLERYSEGVIALTGCLQSRLCRRIVEDRPDEAREHADQLINIFGAEDVYFELQVNGIAEQDKANEGIEQDRARARPPAGRHRRRPLPAARGLRQPRRAALRADQVDAGEPEAALRHQRVLSEERGGDGRVVLALARGGPEHARDRRALRGRDQARRPAAAQVPDPRRQRARGDAAPRRLRGAAPPLRGPGPGRGARAPRVRARRDRGDGLPLLLPDRLGLRPLRQGQRRRRRPRPWLGRGLDRRLLAGDHRPRPARTTTCSSSAS